MRVFTVHIRRHGLDPEKDVRLVKEGFSWPAFLFTFLWALWHRMWWTALGLFVVVTGVGLAVEYLLADSAAGAAVLLALYAGVGYLGNDLLRRHLDARGFVSAGPVLRQRPRRGPPPLPRRRSGPRPRPGGGRAACLTGTAP